MIAAFIQARLGSTRFPNKVLHRLAGTTVIDRVIKAASAIQGVNHIEVLWPEKYDCPEDDVLQRYWLAAQGFHLHENDAIVRITGDCPLLDPAASTLVVRKFLDTGVEYASNVWPRRTWPDGLDTEIFTVSALRMAHHCATELRDREHVTPYMQRNCTTASVELPVDWSWVRLTVDNPADLDWLEQAVAAPRSGLGQ